MLPLSLQLFIMTLPYLLLLLYVFLIYKRYEHKYEDYCHGRKQNIDNVTKRLEEVISSEIKHK